jgi:hypothetical protein
MGTPDSNRTMGSEVLRSQSIEVKMRSPRIEPKNPRSTNSILLYLSASQQKRAIGLRNGRHVGAGGGRLIALSVQIVCAAWRQSLAS